MIDRIALISMACVLTASVWLWVVWIRRWLGGWRPAPTLSPSLSASEGSEESRPAPAEAHSLDAESRGPWNPLATVIAAYWIYAGLKMQLTTPPPARPAIGLDAMRSNVTTNALLVGILLFLLRFVDWKQSVRPLREYGIRPRPFARQLRWGLLGFLASMLPVVVALACTAAWRNADNQHALLKTLREPSNVEIVAWVALSVVVLAPLADELLFRVVLQSALRQVLPATASVALTAVLFCAIHGWPDAVGLFPLALVLGGTFHITRSFLAVATTHALFNAWNLAWALLSANSA